MQRAYSVIAMFGFLLHASACSWSDSQPPVVASPQDVPKIAFEKYTLPNGLEVILSQDRRLPMVAVNLWYHVGPANEDKGRTGFAHLFEHMMFQRSKNVPSDSLIRLLEAAGASDFNGTTDFDRTNYFETLPSNQLELALWLESDRMGYLLDVLDQANLSNQQDVVRNERRQGVENQPYGIVEEEMFHQLFPEGHPYYASVIGSHADIQAAQLEDVKKFFKTYYAPNNASVAIVGDFETDEVKALVKKYFGTLKRGPDVPKIAAATLAITAERRAIVPDRVELPKVYLAWITPSIYQPGDAEADLAAHILGGGRSSRLYKKLVYELQIAQDVSVGQYSLVLGSVFSVEATARPGHSAEELEKAIDAEIESFRADGPAVAEIERARNTIETELVGGLETLGGFGGVADLLNQYNHYLGTPDYLEQDLARYRGATAEAVKQFAANQLPKHARVVVYGIPGTPVLGPDLPAPPATTAAEGAGGEPVNADEAWRGETPKAGPARLLQVSPPTSFKLANGLTVVLNESRNVPIVSEALVFRTGSDSNPIDKPGLANFTVAMLDEGTTTRNALELADELAQIGATLDTESTMDASRVQVRSLRRNAAAAMGILADVVLRSSFPQEEVERQRSQRLGQLVQQREDPGAVAAKTMAAALYGTKHPYGYVELGTEASNQAMTRGDLTAFWKTSFVPNNAALIVAGAIGADELRELAEQSFGAWTAGAPVVPELGSPETTRARVVMVDKPGAAQTVLIVADLGAPRSTPDYPALEIMNASLGGLFSSRINLNLREEHGYTYGAGSVFRYRRSAGPFFVYSPVRTDVTAASLTEIFKELDRMIETPLTADELALARDSIVRSLPGLFETSKRVVDSFAGVYVYDLGLDYFTKYPQQLEAVTIEAAQDVARRYLVPGRMLIVAVGDRAKIDPQLESLNLGATELRDADGKLR
ncbi:MAG: insulinase family protein [Gammaproteobacteria bacterium]|nr:insulinase family protein [Gammaproteobacteria bacterium]